MIKLFSIVLLLVSISFAQNEIYIPQSHNDIANEIFTVDEKNLNFDINYLDKIAQKAIYQAKSLSNKNSSEYTSLADLQSDLFGRENRLLNLINKIDKEKISESSENLNDKLLKSTADIIIDKNTLENNFSSTIHFNLMETVFKDQFNNMVRIKSDGQNNTVIVNQSGK